MNYLSFNEYCKNTFGCKVYKLSLNAGFTCPNRDGSLSTGGCTFCSGGSGRFAVSGDDIKVQLENAKQLVLKKGAEKFIAYFQAYTNTYAPPQVLRELFFSALDYEDVVGISVATRPDCLSDAILELLDEINQIKPVFVELGLQSANEESAKAMNRCYTNDVYTEAVRALKMRKIHVVTHIIFGFPGEREEDMLSTVQFTVRSGTDGVKFHMLNILEGSTLAQEYKSAPFELLSREEYALLVAKAVSLLPKNIVVHRLTGDGDKKILLAPEWVKDKKKTLNLIHKMIMDYSG